MTVNKLQELINTVDGIISGEIMIPTSLGNRAVNRHHIKARTVSGDMMNVGNLEAVSAKTGDLTVNGDIEIITGGNIREGITEYSDVLNSGFWLGDDSGTPKLRLGGPGSFITWDGTSLEIEGDITAESGTIGGWDINATSITHDTGAFGLGTTGSVRIWFGHSTPSSAPFQVSNTGAITATSGSIGGWDIDGILGIRLGSGSTERGMDAGSTAFYAGGTSGSAPFRVTTAGNVIASDIDITGGTITIGSNFSVNASGNITATGGTIGGLTVSSNQISVGSTLILNGSTGAFTATSATITGTISTSNITATGGTVGGLTIGASSLTVGSGENIYFGSGQDDYLGDDVVHFEVGTGQTAKIEFKNGSNPASEIAGSSGSNNSTVYLEGSGSSSRSSLIYAIGSSSDTTTLTWLSAQKSGGATGANYVMRASGSHDWNVDNGVIGMNLVRTNRALYTGGRIYPGSGSGTQTSRYIYDNGTSMTIVGSWRADSLFRYGQLAASGASGSLPNPTKYIAIANTSGTVYYIPIFTAYNPWAA